VVSTACALSRNGSTVRRQPSHGRKDLFILSP
jgi:hypothetical protein